ncbi:uncharacterized protein LOC135471369 isoform X2 [Liolophura sinensis]|uniref:uncharacterized protein LOC135471369 isoform X2 n=1 Tax=Liolophura sinensis TaxID=3198878 RepID=UPI003158D02D
MNSTDYHFKNCPILKLIKLSMLFYYVLNAFGFFIDCPSLLSMTVFVFSVGIATCILIPILRAEYKGPTLAPWTRHLHRTVSISGQMPSECKNVHTKLKFPKLLEGFPVALFRQDFKMLAWSSEFVTIHILWPSLLFLPWGISLAFGPVQPLDFKMTFNKDILAVGETLRLNCSLTTNESAVLEVHHNRRSLTEFVSYSDAHHVEIVIQNVSLEQHGMYHCYKNKNPRPSTISVHVAYPPRKPRNIMCVSESLENMTCTWDPVKTSEQLNIKTNWTLYYKIGIEKKLEIEGSLVHDYACHNPQKAMACKWFKHEQHNGGDYFRPGYFYLIWVNASNVLGSTSSDPQLVDTKAIVKLRPVVEVSVSAVNKSSVHVNWTMTFPSNGRLKLIYNISLTCTECMTAHVWRKGPIRRKASNPLIKVFVNDLEPYTEYRVSVRVKTKTGGYWSEPSEPMTTTTLEGVPRGSPSLTNASFTEFHSSSKGRQLTVYWQDLERKYQGGEITEYLVNVTPPTSGSKGKSISQHRLAGSQAMLKSLNLEDGKQYEVRVAALTKHGYGPYSQPLIIPPESQVTPGVTMVTSEANSSLGFVSWDKPGGDIQATKFLIHYCQGHITQLGTHIAQCTDGYSWLDVDGNQTSATVVMPEHRDMSKYVIGVSMETEVGNSGIVWSPCMFKIQGIPGKLQKIKVEAREFTSVTLTWFPLSCMSARVKVWSYEVSICEEVEERCTCGQVRVLDEGLKMGIT